MSELTLDYIADFICALVYIFGITPLLASLLSMPNSYYLKDLRLGIIIQSLLLALTACIFLFLWVMERVVF